MGALVAVLVTSGLVVSSFDAASASTCNGSYSYGEKGWRYNGATRVKTTAYSSTCDDDGTLVGYLSDPYTDGYDAHVYINESGYYSGTFHTTGGSAWSKFVYDGQKDHNFWLDGYSSWSHHQYNVDNDLRMLSGGH